MHFRSVFYVLGNLLVVLGCAMALPLLVSILSDDSHLPIERYEVLGFLGAIASATISGIALRTVFEADLSRLGNREGCAIVTLTWLLFSLVGCLPFVVTGTAGFTDACFETMSGFTTTGASVLSEMEVLPRGIGLWRCQTQWMGGMGIVVLSVAILPFLGMGGYRMFKAEVPGGSTFERNAPRIKDIAKVLWIMYLGMTVLEVLLLLAGGMELYDAVCHAFTTMSTGGFSTSTQSVAHWTSPWIQWVVIVFMFLAGANFSIYHQLITGPRASALDNPELKVYVILTAVVVALSFGVLVQSGATAGGATARGEPALRAAAFQVASIGTTTGYATEDFERWPDILRLLLLLMMFVGGCTGSTGGGMKVARLMIFVKAVIVELRRTIHPRAVLVVRVGDRALEREVVSNIMSFLAMYIGLFVLVTVVLVMLGLDLTSATSATAANLGNIGPGLGTVGPTASYAHVPTLGKWLLVLCQLLGRLELYSVMVLLLRRTWTR
jgi:trk system potassium uptake protein TrkH